MDMLVVAVSSSFLAGGGAEEVPSWHQITSPASIAAGTQN
jgi:hypothetical protein